jgi:hypothetical protein
MSYMPTTVVYLLTVRQSTPSTWQGGSVFIKIEQAASPCSCNSWLCCLQDGRSSSLTAPNGPSQTALVKSAIALAGE